MDEETGPSGEQELSRSRQGRRGRDVIDDPLLTKGSAFSRDERRALGLLGLLPPHVSSVDEQLARTYENFRRKESDLERYIFLVSLQDRNEALFYMLVQRHISEMMPVIYTPVVGEACRAYSHIYRRPRGLYISLDQADDIDLMLDNAPPDPSIIVVTDGERILGLGDLGVGGLGISIGKLSLYTACAGIHPATTLPIVLDVGTNNPALLNDPLYLGWRHERVRGDRYDAFIETFVSAVARRFPRTLLQWEDFAKGNAARLLERYRDRLCTFNDDIQGTGAVTLAGLLAATRLTGERLRDQRVVLLGAGSSAIGISDQIATAMIAEGCDPESARRAIWLVDSEGLVHSGRRDLGPTKARYAQPADVVVGRFGAAASGAIRLGAVVDAVRPTVLLGTSAQPGAFTEDIVRRMAAAVPRPMIFPLSNPTSRCEATPADLLQWTDGRAIVATGSPFADVMVDGESVRIGQCNNAFIFPGVGLGVLAAQATRVTDSMFVAAARALADCSPALAAPAATHASLYPALESARDISRRVAVAVGDEAQRAGVAPIVTGEALTAAIDARMWTPAY